MTLDVLGIGVKLSHCTWNKIFILVFKALNYLATAFFSNFIFCHTPLLTPLASLGFISSFLDILFSLSQETGTCSHCWKCISSHFLDGNCMLEMLFLLPGVTHPYDGVTGPHITSYEEGVQTLLIWSCVFRKEKLVRYWEEEVQFRRGILTLRNWDPIFFLWPSFSNVGGDGSHIPSYLEY